MKKRPDVKGIALERIETLFCEASETFKKNSIRSHRYVNMALKLAAKSGVRIPKKFRSSYCRKCKHYLSSGVNSKVRTRKGKVVISCLSCGGHRRIMLKPKI